MSLTQPGHNIPPEPPTLVTRADRPAILFVGVDRDILDAFLLTEAGDYWLIVAGEDDNIVPLLLTNQDIKLVVADVPDLKKRCSLGLLIKEYFPKISLLLIAEDNTRDLVCTNCPVGCGASIVDRSRSLNFLLEAVRPIIGCSKTCSMVQDEKRPYPHHPGWLFAIVLSLALWLVVVAASEIAFHFF